MSLVVDASVALKWFLSEEPLADRALAILPDGAALLAPDLLTSASNSARLGCAASVNNSRNDCSRDLPWPRARARAFSHLASAAAERLAATHFLPQTA